MPSNPTKSNPIYLIYMYKEDLALNYLQWLICQKNQPNPTKSYIFNIYMYMKDLALNNLQWLTCLKTQPNQILYNYYIYIYIYSFVNYYQANLSRNYLFPHPFIHSKIFFSFLSNSPFFLIVSQFGGSSIQPKPMPTIFRCPWLFLDRLLKSLSVDLHIFQELYG